jgi:hypothetical protein
MALKQVPKLDELVFYTSKGNPWVRTIQSIDKQGNQKYTKDDAVSKSFSKLLPPSKLKKVLAFIRSAEQLLH